MLDLIENRIKFSSIRCIIKKKIRTLSTIWHFACEGGDCLNFLWENLTNTRIVFEPHLRFIHFSSKISIQFFLSF